MAEIRLGTSFNDQNPWVYWTLIQESSYSPWPVWLWTACAPRFRRVGASEGLVRKTSDPS